MPSDPPSPNFEQQIKTLQAENNQLKDQLRDLEVVIQIMADHGSFIEAELQTANKRLQLEIRERKQAEARLQMLVAAISQRNVDLEIILDTLREHGDAIHDQWHAKVQEANHIAGVDSLTQIPNRRRFDEYLAEQWPLMTDQQSPISLILADIDYFKQYNDTYGHLLGDSCLTYVAQALQNSVNRPTDLVSRYGGEEFAVILPDTDLSGALALANQMQAAVAQLQLPHASSQVSHYITLSLGVVSVVPQAGQASHRLVASTDRQLYRAKQEGRNRIMSGESLDPEQATADGGLAEEADSSDLLYHPHTEV
ncbi:diguanylate cyclase [Leptolyngbya sp. BL0902]|uniref:diguanylate cyclase n=1 Tax=Leptolyngbya sp. BL0902 TaxID=1115757 RepID=UPI0018E7C4AE|nr:diguanylate cyclase [Leptolyngbya sp. BL0902]